MYRGVKRCRVSQEGFPAEVSSTKQRRTQRSLFGRQGSLSKIRCGYGGRWGFGLAPVVAKKTGRDSEGLSLSLAQTWDGRLRSPLEGRPFGRSVRKFERWLRGLILATGVREFDLD
jgi:hypothetical protein